MSKIFELKAAPAQEEKTSEPAAKIKVDPKMNYSSVDLLVQERLKAIEEEKKAARKRRKQEKFLEDHPNIANIKDKVGIKIALKSDVKEKQQKEEEKKRSAEEVKKVAEAPVESQPTLFEGIKSTTPLITVNKSIRANANGKWLPF